MARLAVTTFLLAIAASAEAYVGPGMGLGVIGAIFGLLMAVVLALAGMVWYPVKRLIHARRGSPAPAKQAAGPVPSTAPGRDGIEPNNGA